jgi:hypothetical protein
MKNLLADDGTACGAIAARLIIVLSRAEDQFLMRTNTIVGGGVSKKEEAAAFGAQPESRFQLCLLLRGESEQIKSYVSAPAD